MDTKFFPPPNRPRASAGKILGSAYLISTTSLLLPREFSLRKYLPIPPILYLCYYTRCHRLANLGEDYLIPIDLVWLLVRWIDITVLHDPEKDLHRLVEGVREKDNGASAGVSEIHVETFEDVERLSPWRRITRTLHLITNCRGAGWTWRVKNVDPVVERTRSDFLRSRLLLMLRSYLLTDLAAHFLHKIFLLHSSTTRPLSHQIFLSWLNAFKGGFDLSLSYAFASFLAVLLHLDTPSSYPPLNGPVSSCYTIRAVWGHGWHQFLRRPIEGTGNSLASWLGLRKGGLASRYFRLYWGFWFSAALHFMGTANVPYVDGDGGWANWIFFCGQAVGITIEDLVKWAGKRVGMKENGFTKTIGFAWVVGWFSVMLTIWSSQMLALGTHEIKNPMIVFSIADRLFGKTQRIV